MKKILFITILTIVFLFTSCANNEVQSEEENLALVLSVSENSITIQPLWDFEGYEEVVVSFDEDTKWFSDDVVIEEGQTIGLILHDRIMESFPPQVIAKEITSLE